MDWYAESLDSKFYFILQRPNLTSSKFRHHLKLERKAKSNNLTSIYFTKFVLGASEVTIKDCTTDNTDRYGSAEQGTKHSCLNH